MLQRFDNESAETLADYTAPPLLVGRSLSCTAAGVVSELCALLRQEGRLPDATAFYNAVMAREQLSSTAISSGWALPHARLSGLPSLSFALARSTSPFSWSGGSQPPVHTVFLFAAPDSAAKAYLTLISAVARLSRSAELVEQLEQAQDAGALFAVLQQVPLCQPDTKSTRLVSSGRPSLW